MMRLTGRLLAALVLLAVPVCAVAYLASPPGHLGQSPGAVWQVWNREAHLAAREADDAPSPPAAVGAGGDTPLQLDHWENTDRNVSGVGF